MSASSHALPRPLPPDLAQRYHRDGFVVLDSAFSDAQVDAVNAEVVQVLRGRRGEVSGLTPSTDDWSDEDVLRAHLAVHEPHKLSPLLEGMVHEPDVVEPLTRVIGPDVKAVQVMAFVKSEGRPGQAWHQDEHFIPTRDRSLTAAWVALDDATVENGCLWVIPGSHRAGVLHPTRHLPAALEDPAGRDAHGRGGLPRHRHGRRRRPVRLEGDPRPGAADDPSRR